MSFQRTSATKWRKIRREIFRRSAARFAPGSVVHPLAGVATIYRPSGPKKPETQRHKEGLLKFPNAGLLCVLVPFGLLRRQNALNRVVQRVPLDGDSAGITNELFDLCAAHALARRSTGAVNDPFFNDGSVEIVGTEPESDLRQ